MIALWIEMLAVTLASEPRSRSRLRRAFFRADRTAPQYPQPQPPRTIDLAPAPRRRASLAPLGMLVIAFAVLVYGAILYPWFLNWGATAEEQHMALPGDELMERGEPYFTRAITIDAAPSAVWLWIVQMGQERAGFYSNTWLENLTGANIHNANTLYPQWRNRHVGEVVLLARRDLLDGTFSSVTQTRIVGVERERWIAYIPTRFVLQPVGPNTTRLLLRETLPSSWITRLLNAVLWDPMHFVMEQRMLRGIKERAEDEPLVDRPYMVAAQAGWIAAAFGLVVFFLLQRGRIAWLVVPLFWAVPVMIFTSDWQAALTAFNTLGILVGGALMFGKRWMIGGLVVASVAGFILLLSPEPYLVLGYALGAAAVLVATFR